MLLVAAAVLACASCKDDTLGNQTDEVYVSNLTYETTEVVDNATKEMMLADFAKSLSYAISEREEVREFLKDKALEQFDRNYDVLYLAVKDEKISGVSFEDILESYPSCYGIKEISQSIPLLNIYLTKIEPLLVFPEDFDTSEEETPTAVVMQDSTRFYVNGHIVETWSKGEVPDFHTFVVGENTRVVIDGTEGNLKSATIGGFHFKDPVFDGTLEQQESSLKSLHLTGEQVGQRAIDSYKYFYKDDNSIYQKALQRDYIYYGITPENQQGSLLKSVTEHICKIKVDPKAFFKIRDHIDGDNNIYREDPDIINNGSHLSVGHQTSDQDLINILWSRGTYDFRFDVIKSNEGNAESVYIPARPEDLWDFHIEYWYRHKTKFRHSRHHYTIDPNKFTAKEYTPTFVPDLGKWDISEEALYRYVNVWEEDKGTEVEDRYSYEMTKVKSTHFSGEVKLSIGLKKTNSEIDAKLTTDKSETEKVTREVVIKRKDSSDNLGKVSIYYYDPIIEGKEKGIYKTHEYNTGLISFSITAY